MILMTSTSSIRTRTSKAPRVILGIDPGYGDTGFGIIRASGNSFSYITCGLITTPRHAPLAERLYSLQQRLDDVISRFHPHVVAVEKIFFAKNVTTALAVAHARGVILLAAASHNLPIVEYTPLEVKMSVTSYGTAGKPQVAGMVRRILEVPTLKQKDDAIDALAVALCAAFRSKILM